MAKYNKPFLCHTRMCHIGTMLSYRFRFIGGKGSYRTHIGLKRFQHKCHTQPGAFLPVFSASPWPLAGPRTAFEICELGREGFSLSVKSVSTACVAVGLSYID